MTDLHTHILPGMDDGPKTPEEARLLLELELRQGVRRAALTSHYHCESESPEAFLERRAAAWQQLSGLCPEGLELKLGCEVFFSPQLLSFDLQPLCLEGTRVLLLELPVLQKPAFAREVLMGLHAQNIVPMLAHVERYQYVRRDPALLRQWQELGCLIQLNAASLIEDAFAQLLVRRHLADVVASDAHSAQYRPPLLHQALYGGQRALDPQLVRELEERAGLIYSGEDIPTQRGRVPRRVLGFWF